MSLLYELNVFEFLTCDRQVFVCPQFDVGNKCPDFCALDLRRSEIVIVEVSARSAPATISSRVINREHDWYCPSYDHLKSTFTGDWPIRFLGFVRKEICEKLTAKFTDSKDVTFYPLQSAMMLHEFWERRREHGLPDKRLPQSIVDRDGFY